MGERERGTDRDTGRECRKDEIKIMSVANKFCTFDMRCKVFL